MRFLAGSLFLFATLVGSPAFAQPSITFNETEAVVSGVTPGGNLCWLAVARASHGYAPRIVIRHEIVPDDDRDGLVRITNADVLHPDSAWIVVDLTSGEAAIASPRPDRVDDLDGLTPAALVSNAPPTGWSSRGST